MKKASFLRQLEKILEQGKNRINEDTKFKTVQLDSLKVLELMAFNDSNFKGLYLTFFCFLTLPPIINVKAHIRLKSPINRNDTPARNITYPIMLRFCLLHLLRC